MAITNAQQYKQLMQNGGRIGLKGGGADMGAEDKKSVDSRASKGYGAPSDSKPTYGGGGGDGVNKVDEVALTGGTKTKPKVTKTKDKEKNFIKDYIKDYIKDRQKLAFNASMLIPGQKKRSAKYQKAYKDYLESMGVTPPDTLTGEEDDLAGFFINNAFDKPVAADANVQPPQSYGDFLLENFGAPGVKFSGNVGGKEVYVKGTRPDGSKIYDVREERGGGRDDFILPISQPVASIPEPTGYVNPLSLLTPRIAGTRFLGTELEDEEDTEFAANGGRIGFGGGSDMGTVADSKGSVGPSKGGYQGGGTGPVERPGGGGNGGPKTTPTNVGGGGGGVTTLKTKKDIRTPSDFTKFDLKDLVNLYQDEEEDNMLMAGLNQPQVDYLNKVGGKVYNVDKTGDFFNYDSPTNIKKQIEKLNPESENIFGTFKPSKIVEGDPSTYATEKDVQDYIKSQFPTLRTDGREIGLAGGGIASLDREAFIFGGIAKGLKKAIRGVKKLAKSPIGKAALAFGAYKLGSGFLKNKGIMSSLFGEYGGTSRMTDGLLGKLGITGGGGSKALTGLGKGVLYAGVPAAIAALTTPEEDDKFDIDAYYAANRLNSDTPLNKRILGTEFYAAEGGMPSKEPVAKKTMPLLDMDGQEMDLREEGGFVPLGRMERADDVPARLSKNEFVFTADAVRNAGEGDIDKGAEVMYNMMKNLESGGEVSEESQGLDGAREMFQTSKRLEEVL